VGKNLKSSSELEYRLNTNGIQIHQHKGAAIIYVNNIGERGVQDKLT